MSRDASHKAQQAFNKTSATADTFGNRATSVFNTLAPTVEGDIKDPQGYNPEQLSAMRTASGQSLGGSVAGAVGQGNLTAARTRNEGGEGAALDEASRSAGRQLSTNELGVQKANADLEQQKRAEALKLYEDMYGQNSHATLSALSLLPGDVNAQSGAGRSGWFQNFTDTLSALNHPGGG